MPRTLLEPPPRMTYREFRALPNDGFRYEVLEGQLVMSPSPAPLHQLVLARLFADLNAHVNRANLGIVFFAPLDVLLSRYNIVEPDIVYVSRSRMAIITPRNIRGAPDLHVEVVSPSLRSRDLRDKRAVYARCGVPHYWIVQPRIKAITELQLDGRKYVETAELRASGSFRPALFPGLQFNLTNLFAPI